MIIVLGVQTENAEEDAKKGDDKGDDNEVNEKDHSGGVAVHGDPEGVKEKGES